MKAAMGLLGSLLLAASAVAAPISEEMGVAFGLYSDALKAGDHKLALTHAGTVETLAARELNADDPSRLAASLNYATALLNVKENKRAIRAFEKSLALYEAAYGETDERLLGLLVRMVAASGDHFSSSPQDEYARRAMKIAKSAHGGDSVDYARYAFDVGKQVFHYQPSTKSIRFIREANTIFTKQLGPSDVETARTEFLLGKFALMQKRHKAAEKHFVRALQGFEQDPSPAGFDSSRITRGFLVNVYETMNQSEKATEHCIAIGSMSPAAPDEEMLPVFRRAPSYPVEMLREGKSGYVEFRYTVDSQGFVRDPVVTKVTDREFVDAATQAVEGFRYAPRFSEGKPVATENVRTRIRFETK